VYNQQWRFIVEYTPEDIKRIAAYMGYTGDDPRKLAALIGYTNGSPVKTN
jgi:hypothetical protein